MRPTLVIGASGTVGRQVIAELVASDVPVRALTRDPGRELPGSIQVVTGDVARPDKAEPAGDRSRFRPVVNQTQAIVLTVSVRRQENYYHLVTRIAYG